MHVISETRFVIRFVNIIYLTTDTPVFSGQVFNVIS